MRTPLLLADFTLARPCKPFCEKFLTLPLEVAILAFQQSWNSVEASQRFIDSERMKTFAYYISVVASPSGNTVAGQGIGAAGVLLLVLPCLILFIILQSKVMSAVAHSGIK